MRVLSELQAAKDKGDLEQFILEAVASHPVETFKRQSKMYAAENPDLTALKIRVTVGTGENSETIDLSPKRKKYSGFGKIIVSHGVSRIHDNPVQIALSVPKNTESEKQRAAREQNDRDRLKAVLGKNFNKQLVKSAEIAAVNGVSWTYAIDGTIFKASEFVPIYADWDGKLQAGIRFWQVGDADKAVKYYQLYEIEGVTAWKKTPSGDELQPIDSERNPVVTTVQIPHRQTVDRLPSGQSFRATPNNPAVFPVIPRYFNRQRTTEFTKDVWEAVTYYEIKDTVYSDKSIREPNVRYTITGYGGDIKNLAETVRKMQDSGILADRRLDGESSVSVQAFELPYLSHKEALEMTETAIFMWAQYTNPKVLVTGGVTAKAIALALQREDAKMVGVEDMAREYVENYLAVFGVTASRIMFKHVRPSDDMQTAQILQIMLPDLPPKYRVILCPAVPAEMHDEIIRYMEDYEQGMTEEDREDYERLLAAERAANGAED